jgi:hypothetical protein
LKERYIVCRSHQEAAKDAADRASIVAALERQLAKGDKAPVSNTGFRRYLKTISGEHFAIDPDKIEDDVLTCRFTTASGENSGWPQPITAEALCASQRGTHRPSNKNRLREMIAPGSTPE